MLKLDRIIQLVRLNAEMAPIAVNDFGEQEGGSPNTTAKVWAQRTITSGRSFFRSDGRTERPKSYITGVIFHSSERRYHSADIQRSHRCRPTSVVDSIG